jgi:predicted nucleotidyltransferase
MVLPPTTSAAVAEFSERVRARFGARLNRLALFGSHARGQASEDSDVDVLVVVEELTSADARAIDAIVGDILTRADVLLSPLVLSAARFGELRARERRLVAEIDRDGIAV